jgi:methyl-accepting chemotaxis protein
MQSELISIMNKQAVVNTNNTENMYQTALTSTLLSFYSQKTPNQVIDTALHHLRQSFGFAYASFWKCDLITQELVFAQESGTVNAEFTKATHAARFAKGVGLNGRAWATGKMFYTRHLKDMTDCCRAEPATRAGVNSGICLPVFCNGTLLGTMDFFTLEPLDMTDNLRAIFDLLAQAISQTVSSITTVKDSDENTQALFEVVNSISKSTSPENAITLALNAVKHCFGWAYGSYWTLDEAGKYLQFNLETGAVTPEFSEATQNARFEKGVGLSGKTWAKDSLMFVKNLGEMVDCCRRESALKAGVKSGVCFPIHINGKFAGTMDFFTTEVIELNDERTKTLSNVGNIISNTLTSLVRLEKGHC